MPVEWKDAFFRDGEHPQTLEDAVMVTAAYGGVHDFDFQNDVDESFSVLTNWILDDDAEATVSASFLELMGGGGSNKWYLETFADEISLGLVASFD
jgi:hypothetical protein